MFLAKHLERTERVIPSDGKPPPGDPRANFAVSIRHALRLSGWQERGQIDYHASPILMRREFAGQNSAAICSNCLSG